MNYNYDSVDTKQLVVDTFKADLPVKGYAKVKVLKADPQGPSELPCVCVNRASDDETSMALADYHGESYDAATQTLITTQGTFFSEALEIRVWHTNADERDKLYLTVRAILFANRPVFIQKGLLNITLRAGRDEQDSSMSQAPTVMYWGVITMLYLSPLNVDVIDIVAPISSNAVTSIGKVVP